MRSPWPSLPILVGIAALVVLALFRADAIRERAEDGLGRGVPAREAELARGFVLGEDDDVDAATKEDFRRAGLSHLLAVSGQNVALLALLALPLLAAFGIPLRERLLWVIALIAVYVPLAGAGPSIQRAAVMGVAGLLATLAGRRSSRLYALLLALIVTLAIDPGIAADIGWQLSFAAVAGIFVLVAPLRRAFAAGLGAGPLRAAVAEGAAVTVAATLATAPLIAFHFETLSTTTLVANLLAMPAVAPAMWLGMASAAAAQVPGLPLEPLNWLASLLLAYIAQVAAWCAAPGWAEVHLHLSAAGLAASYLGLAALAVAGHRLARRRRLALRARGGGAGSAYPENQPAAGRSSRRRSALMVLPALAALAVLALAGTATRPQADSASGPVPGLRVTVLDVGQGDAILLQPAATPAILVDGGPPGDDLTAKLRAAGVDRLAAAIVSHDQSDHAGGIAELLGQLPLDRLLYARAGRDLLGAARAAGVDPIQVGEGAEVRSGSLHLRVLWPPRELLGDAAMGVDPNQLALVLLARWHDFSMLLSADAEAEAVPLDPGPIDVLKVAHHGSEDAGLASLLDRTRPRLAVISVGAANPYGHPTAATVSTLDRHGVATLRTDRDGTVIFEVRPGSVAVEGRG
jgi:competence protein ComEC